MSLWKITGSLIIFSTFRRLLIDSLPFVTLSQREHVDIILERLPTEYESTVTFIYNKSKLMPVDDVESLLLAHESCIAKLTKKSLGLVNLTECNLNSTPNSSESQSQVTDSSNFNPQVHLTQASNNTSNDNGDYNNPVITTILPMVVVAGIIFTTVAVGGGHGGMVVESLLMYNVRFVISMVTRQPFSIIGMMITMFPCNLWIIPTRLPLKTLNLRPKHPPNPHSGLLPLLKPILKLITITILPLFPITLTHPNT